MMTLNESIGRFSAKKTLRFEMKPVGKTADHLSALLADDEDHAASLNTVKDFIQAEHLALIRRVFKALPDPMPEQAAIQAAFKADPQFKTLIKSNANDVLDVIINRYRYNRWALPKPIQDLERWQPLFIKWHWHCNEPYQPNGTRAIAREWAGRPKALIGAASVFLRPLKKRNPSRNYWFDHGPFRMMFGNRACGMSWLKEDFTISRTFLLKDGDRVLIGIVPRSSKFDPYVLAEARPMERAYSLYEETAGEKPAFRSIPRSLIDVPARCGFVYLFELSGRGLRGNTNLNAIYLRALFSSANMLSPALHLDKVCEFYSRKGTDLPREGLPEHFRQRFTEDKFFVTLHITCNPQFVAIRKRPRPFGDLARFLQANPDAQFTTVRSATGGYDVDGEFVPAKAARNGALAGRLAKIAVERDVCLLFDPSVPKSLAERIADKFGYIVVRGRDPSADGGALRGYQLVDRVFIGRISEARTVLEVRTANQTEKERKKAAYRDTLEKAHQAKLARHAAQRARNEELLRLANERRAVSEKLMGCGSAEVFNTPLFQTGSLLFKFCYRTSDNKRHEYLCRADSKDEVFQKLRTVGVRPSWVKPECG